VINVSWNDAKAYVAWLSRKTGKQYRLPTEAEWEYAARGGTTTTFSFGQTITTDQVNYDGSPSGLNRQKTLPVGSFPANAFGLHDMHGNVWEWIEDCWSAGTADTPANGAPFERQMPGRGHRAGARGRAGVTTARIMARSMGDRRLLAKISDRGVNRWLPATR
jgi:formylglycine-generating enzyme required for sulfatase activity